MKHFRYSPMFFVKLTFGAALYAVLGMSSEPLVALFAGPHWHEDWKWALPVMTLLIFFMFTMGRILYTSARVTMKQLRVIAPDSEEFYQIAMRYFGKQVSRMRLCAFFFAMFGPVAVAAFFATDASVLVRLSLYYGGVFLTCLALASAIEATKRARRLRAFLQMARARRIEQLLTLAEAHADDEVAELIRVRCRRGNNS